MHARALGYWAATALAALAFTGSGIMNIMQPPELAELIAHLEYPAWFTQWLGTWKLAGVVVLLAPGLPRLKEWATAGFVIAMTSASVSHIAAGDAIGQAVPPLVLLSLVLLSYFLRPESRRLSSPQAAAAPVGGLATAK